MSRTSYLSRRLFVVAPWLLVGGCSAAPPPPPPAVLRAPPVAEVKKPPPPAPWIEISGEDSRTSIVGYASDGRPTYHFRVKYLKGVALSPEGEACFVANTPSNNWGGGVSLDFTCVDRAGRVLWQHKDVGDLSYRLLLTGDKLRAFWSGGFSTFDALTGKETAGLPFPSFSDMMVSEDLIATVGAQISLRTLEGDVLWSVAARPFSSPTSPSFGGTAVAVDSGGTVLAGAFDGTLVAIARDGKPLYQLGVHGRVEHIESRTDGDFVVHTPRRAIVIGPGGVVRREVDDSDEPSPKTGIVDRRSPPHRPPLPLTAGYLVEQARLSGQPFEEIMSVAPLGPNDTWAMGSWSDDLRLYHFDGRAWTVMGPPRRSFPKRSI